MRVVKITIYTAILIFMVLFSGCTTAPGKVSEVNSTNTVASTTVATVSPSVTISIPSATASPTLLVGFTSEDVNLHFMDLAFGGGNVYLERQPFSTTVQKPVSISVSNPNTDDIKIIEKFAVDFNGLSQSTKLSENVKEGTTGQIQVKFIPPAGFGAIEMAPPVGVPINWVNKEFKKDGVTYAKVKNNIIYINSDLQGAERQHDLLLALLFELGFKGSTMKYPDSIFFDSGNDVTSLSKIDSKAVQIMYGQGMYQGMTVDDVKKRVLITSS
ncbi:MAG: hypothetical protein NTV68_14720 [Methanomicrobiales archaeon]|nr:hypothetical protein [Methanomicrobiales archaeon]